MLHFFPPCKSKDPIKWQNYKPNVEKSVFRNFLFSLLYFQSLVARQRLPRRMVIFREIIQNGREAHSNDTERRMWKIPMKGSADIENKEAGPRLSGFTLCPSLTPPTFVCSVFTIWMSNNSDIT